MAGSRLKKGQVYWMAGSTFKEGAGLLDGWLHIEGRGIYWMAGTTLKEWTGLLDGWLYIEGR